MNVLINLGLKFSGLSALWSVIDGYKTYIAAAIAILSGLLGLVQEVQPLLAAHNAAGLLDFVKALPQDQAWIMLAGGLATLGLGHKLDKAAAPAADPQAAKA